MSFHFKYEGADVDIDDVPLSVYAQIEKETDVSWFQLQRSPLRYADAGERLAKACARIAGVELPELTPRLLVEVFDLVEGENRPSEYQEGMPDPKAEGSEPVTT